MFLVTFLYNYLLNLEKWHRFTVLFSFFSLLFSALLHFFLYFTVLFQGSYAAAAPMVISIVIVPSIFLFRLIFMGFLFSSLSSSI